MSVKVVVEITEGKDGSFHLERRIENVGNPTAFEAEGAAALFECFGAVLDLGLAATEMPKKEGGAE
jgi:hypothetical protein